MQMGGTNGREPVFSLVGTPVASAGPSSTSDHSAATHAGTAGAPPVTGLGLGFGRQAELARQEQERSIPSRASASPFADPDPFRSTPPATVIAHSNAPSTDSNHQFVSVSRATGLTEGSTTTAAPSPIHAATLPFSVAMPAPGVPIMKPMKATTVDPPPMRYLPPPRSLSSPPESQGAQPPQSLPLVSKDMADFTNRMDANRTPTAEGRQIPTAPEAANPNAASLLFASRHRTNTINPFDDNNSIDMNTPIPSPNPVHTPTHGQMGRSFDSTNQSSFLSSGESIYSADETTDAGTDDGIPTTNRVGRHRELHASDLYVPRVGDQRTSRAMSSVSTFLFTYSARFVRAYADHSIVIAP